MCAAGLLPFGVEALRGGIEKFMPPKLIDVNLRALELGAERQYKNNPIQAGYERVLSCFIRLEPGFFIWLKTFFRLLRNPGFFPSGTFMLKCLWRLLFAGPRPSAGHVYEQV